MAIQAFVLGLIALLSSIVGVVAWVADRAGRNSVRAKHAEDDIATAQVTMQRTQAIAQAAASNLTDDEELQLLRDGKA